MYYRLQHQELLRRAIDRGLGTTGTAIAHSVGLTPPTVNALIAGRPARAETIARLTVELGCRVEEIFSVVLTDADRADREARMLSAVAGRSIAPAQ